MRLYSTLAFLCAVKFIFLKIYSMLILYSHISRSGFEVLNEILQISAYVTISLPSRITICTTISKFLNILSLVDLLMKILYYLAE